MIVNSVTGPVELDATGIILAHEHLVIDYGQMRGEAPPVASHEEDACVAAMALAHEAGVRVVVDCTPPGYGRDLALLRTVSRRSGVVIVASTGTFCEQWHPQPPWVQRSSRSELAAAFVAELRRECGVIKVAISAVPTSNELRALDAAADAHRETGARIVCHTTGGFGVEALQRLVAAGVPSGAVLVSHVCAADEPTEDALAIARLGAFVGLDRIGHAGHDDDHWISIVGALREEGLQGRVLLSHDSVQVFRGPEPIAGHTVSNPVDLLGSFTRRARQLGLSGDELRGFLSINPLTWLTAKERPE